MTSEERLAVVESELRTVKERAVVIDTKLDHIIAAVNMGRGAWILLLKLGAIVMAIAAGATWVYDHIHK
jgi:hypothetical protein